jgi:hypothetical protein
MARPRKRPVSRARPSAGLALADYDPLFVQVSQLVEQARHAAARTVNATITATYWEVGRVIFEHEQRGASRAAYGEQLIRRQLPRRCLGNLPAREFVGRRRRNLLAPELSRQRLGNRPPSRPCSSTHWSFPDTPSNRYPDVAPRVRALAARYGLPYNTGSLTRQFGTTTWTIWRLAFPGGGTASP